MQMKLDKLTQPGWGDAADYFNGKDMKYGTSILRVVAVIILQMNDDAGAPAHTSFGELM